MPSFLRRIRIQNGPGAVPTLLLVMVVAFLIRVDRSPALDPFPERSTALEVRRETFIKKVLLTGVLESVEGAYLVCPRTPGWQVPVRWMEEDGARVARGQVVVELDNSMFTESLEEKRLAARKGEIELLRIRAQAEAERAEKAFAVEERRVELEKARIDGDVPKELIPLREYQEKELAVERARVAWEKAKTELSSQVEETGERIAVQKASLQKTRYEIRLAEAAIETLRIEAPRDGIFIVGENRYEGRKLQVGDTVWPGIVLAQIPDLSAMRIEATLSDVDDGALHKGQSATVVLDSFPETRFPATIDELTPVAQEIDRWSSRRAFQVRVALARTDEGRMRPGMAVRVEVLADERPNALVAPRAALDLDATPPQALLLDGRRIPIELGPCNALECVIESGLEAGRRLSSLQRMP